MFTLPDLLYAYDALEPFIDEQTMRLHHDEHHAGYVNKLNTTLKGYREFMGMEINDLLKDLTRIPKEILTAVRNNGGGHANHSLFWTVMGSPSNAAGPNKGGEPEGELKEEITGAFGDFASLRDKFSQAALSEFPVAVGPG